MRALCFPVVSAAQLLVGIYIDSGTPVKIAEGFLAVFTTGNAAPPHPQPARHSRCDAKRAGKYSGNAGLQFDVAQHDERAAAAAAPVSTLVQVRASLHARRPAASSRAAEVPRPRVRSRVDRRPAEEASGGKRAPAKDTAPLCKRGY